VAASDSPRLVVILVIDQFRADYIDTYGQQWTHGLRRLVDGGARFTDAAYPYFSTVTCAGHATIATGSFPATHGMIANSWWDRDWSFGALHVRSPDTGD
jgi:predicted AlkP superfamily pyrophosphatase or phosphodiesterase